jgi:hypothetical protein
VRLDLSVVAGEFATGLLAVIAPTLRVARTDVIDALRQNTRRGKSSYHDNVAPALSHLRDS